MSITHLQIAYPMLKTSVAHIQLGDCRMYSDLYRTPSASLSPIPFGLRLPDVVAVKCARVHPSGSSVASALCSIQTFLQDHERLCHPHIVRFLGYAVIGEVQPSLLSPFYRNGNIMAYLKCNSEADKMELLSGIFQAVGYLHKHGVPHKNIIPNNILIDDEGKACLSDIGVSSLLQEMSPFPQGRPPEAFIYKPSEEFVADVPLDVPMWLKVDVYSFTSAIYEVLSGDLPISPSAKRYRHSHHLLYAVIKYGHLDVPRPPSITLPAWQAIQLGWTRDPDLRPSILDLAAAFLPSLAL